MSLTLAAYAEAKKLDVKLLTQWGLTEHTDKHGAPYVRIPYLDETGSEVAARQRLSLDGAARFRWRTGTKPCLYGLDQLPLARAKGFAVIVEGESDCHTLRQWQIPAFGLPGAALWNEARDAKLFDGIERIFVVHEGDRGGDAVTAWLSKSAIASRAFLVTFDGEVKDPSALYLRDPAGFGAAFQAMCQRAAPWAAVEDAETSAREARAFEAAGALPNAPDIIALFAGNLSAAGLVGEDRNACVLYLALTSRLLKKPVSVAYKGPSSGGKSYAVERVLAHFPDDARVSITSMSEKALIFMEDDLKHKHLVIAEAEGASGEFQEYLIRSLLSEGKLEHRMAEKTENQIVGRHIVKEGPTGLIITTTRVKLHPENETRLISLSANDTREQTRAVLDAVASREAAADVDAAWPALQTWLSYGERAVVVPYARVLASLVSDRAVRMRRDFGQLLSLVEAHALLHRATRARDAEGRIVATLDDYGAVRALIIDVMSEGIAATVPPIMRETVEAVRTLSGESGDTVSLPALARLLSIDKSTAMRRCLSAKMAGYLINEQTVRGREAQYRLGEPLPADAPALPSVAALTRAIGNAAVEAHERGERGEVTHSPETARNSATPDRCTVACETEGDCHSPLLPPDEPPFPEAAPPPPGAPAPPPPSPAFSPSLSPSGAHAKPNGTLPHWSVEV